MKLLFDENLSPKHATTLSTYFDEVDATPTKRAFGLSAKDPQILEALEAWKPRPTLVTADRKIGKKKLELRRLIKAKCNVIVLAANVHDFKAPDQAWRLLKIWPTISENLAKAASPLHIYVDLRKETVKELTLVAKP